MAQEKRMIGDYEVLVSIRIGEYEILICECSKPAIKDRFVCGFYEDDGIMMQLKGCAFSDNYAETAKLFGERVKEKAEETQMKIQEELEIVGKDETLTADDCMPARDSDLLIARVVVIDPEVLRPEYRRSSHQLQYCTGGFGAQPNARGTSCFCKRLIDGRDARYCRSDIIGVVPEENLPEWARVRLEEIRESAERTKDADERGGR